MAAIFQTTFLNAFTEWICMNFAQDFTDICSLGLNERYSNTGSDNGLSPSRHQAII